MTLEELAHGLPNGFHDSEFKTVLVDYDHRRITIEVSVWVATEDGARELYRDGTLSITGLQLLTVEPPDPRYEFSDNRRLWVDLVDGPTQSQVPAISAIPSDCFASGL